MFKSNKFSAFLLGFAAILFSVAIAFPAQAADIVVNTSDNAPYSHVNQGENHTNLYIIARQVVVDSNTTKDLSAVGGSVVVNGNVEYDLTAIGGNVDVKGSVGGSARIAAGNINIDGKVNGDLVVAGGNVYLNPGAEVNGDVLVAGGNIYINAPVKGNLDIAGGSAYVNSSIGGSINARMKGTLQLDKSASVGGNVNYTGRGQIHRDSAAHVSGNINYTQTKSRHYAGVAFVSLILKLLALLLAALILFSAFTPQYENLIQTTQRNFWRNFGYGLIAFIVVPIIVIILLLMLVGYYVAILLALWYVFMLLISWILGATVFGGWVLRKVSKREFPFSYIFVTFAIIISVVLSWIPVVGWIFALILTLAGFGSLIRNHRISQH